MIQIYFVRVLFVAELCKVVYSSRELKGSEIVRRRRVERKSIGTVTVLPTRRQISRLGVAFVCSRFVCWKTDTRRLNWAVRSPQCMDMVVKIMQAGVPTQFDLEKYSTPLFRNLREKARKRTATEAFSKTADALDDLELAPRVKRVVRRPPPALTIYVRRETEKAYNAIMLEEITVESLKLAVSEKYGTPTNTIQSFALRCKEG